MTESGLTHSTVQDLPNFDRAKLRLAVVPETGGSAGMPYKPGERPQGGRRAIDDCPL